MSEPIRLLDGDATSFERQLLASVVDEPVPAAQRARMAFALGLGSLGLHPESARAESAVSQSHWPPAAGPAIEAGAGAITPGALPSATAVASTILGKTLFGAATVIGLASAWFWLASAKPPAVIAPAVLAATQPEVLSPAPEVRAEEAPAANAPLSADNVVARGAAPREQASRIEGGTAPRSQMVHPAAAPRPEGARSDVEAELALLDPARAAIARGDRRKASEFLVQYRRRFPNGMLQREAGLLRASLETPSDPRN